MSLLDLKTNPSNVVTRVKKLERRVNLLSRALSAEGYVEAINEDPGEGIGNADTVDGIHASAAVTADKLLALNGSALWPASTIEGITSVTWTGTHTFPAATGIFIGADVQLTRGAADRLDLASGDSLRLVSGELQFGSSIALAYGAADRLDLASGDNLRIVSGQLQFGSDVVLSRGAADRLDLASGDSLNIPNGKLTITKTSTQMTVYYDSVHYADLTVGSGGTLTIAPTGDIVLDPGASDVLPGGSIEDDLGDYNRMWRTLFAAELYVETLVAQDVLATIGGRIMVAPTTKLTADVASGVSAIETEHNNLAVNDYALLKAAPGGIAQIEVMQITGGPTGSGPYTYNVTRNLDGTGANNWYKGDAVVNLGYAVGEGYIELTSTQTIHNHLGPNITIYSRTDRIHWNDSAPVVTVGNMESFLGYSSDEFGLAAGNDLTTDPATGGFSGFSIDRTNGLRLYNTGLEMYDGTDLRIKADPTSNPMWWMGPSASDKRFTVAQDGAVWLSTLAISSDLGDWLFNQADGLLLMGPPLKIIKESSTNYWVGSRGEKATVSGALNSVQGRWAGTRALKVEPGTTNYIENPIFNANVTDFWSMAQSGSGGTLTWDTGVKLFGAGSAKLKAGTALVRLRSDVVSLNNGATVTIQARVFRSSDISAALVIYDSTNLTVRASVDYAGVGAWEYQEVSWTNSTGSAVSVRLEVWNSENDSTSYFYVDGCQMEKTDYATSLCHGSMGDGYAWSGAEHDSASTRTATVVNLDNYAALISGNNTFSVRIIAQMPYDADVTWPNSTVNYLFDAYSASGRIICYYRSDSDKFAVRIGAADRALGSVQDFSRGDWFDLVFTFDFSDDDYNIYVNGILDGNGTTAMSAQTITDLTMGVAYNGSAYWGGFAFAEFAVFDRVLSADEVASLYAAGKPLVDAGTIGRPGIYILDGEFRLQSSQTGARVEIDEDGIRAYSNESGNPQSVAIDTDGDLFLGSDISAAATTALAVFANTQTYNSESMGAGDLLIGDNSASKANILWDKSDGKLKFRSGTNSYIYIDTNGSIVINANAATSYLNFNDGATTYGKVYVNASNLYLWASNNLTITASSGAMSIVASTTATLQGTTVNLTPTSGGYVDVTTGGLVVDCAATGISNGEFRCNTDARVGGGLAVGSLSLDPDDDVIQIANGSTPGTPTGGPILYAVSGELYVKDTAGNATRLSSHEGDEWVFYSENAYTGRRVRIAMERLVREIERISGQRFLIEEFVEVEQ